MLLHWRPLLRVSSNDSIRSPSSRVYGNVLCRVGNSKSSLEVNWRLVSGKAVQCRRCSSTSLSTGDAANNRGPTTWHQVDPHLNAWRSGLRWRSSTGLTNSSAHAREDFPSLHLCTASRSEDQPEEDRSHDAECTTSCTSQSERRRPSNNWGVHLPWQHRQTWWRNGQRHLESPQQGQKRLQNDEQCLEVILVQHQDQTRAVCFPPYYAARNAGGWRSVTWTSWPPSTQRISRIFWLETTSNQQLLACCNQESMETIILRRWWG